MKSILVQLSDGRLCDSVPVGSEFPVAAGLTWVEVADTVDGSTHMYAEGLIIPIVPPVPAIPTVVGMRQARRALIAAGLYATVNAAVAAIPGVDGDVIRVEWEFSPIVKRDSPFVVAMAASLPLTELQLDELFAAAASF